MNNEHNFNSITNTDKRSLKNKGAISYHNKMMRAEANGQCSILKLKYIWCIGISLLVLLFLSYLILDYYESILFYLPVTT